MPKNTSHTGRRLQDVLVTSDPDLAGSTEETHPAFGVAVVHRSSGGSRTLFQSDVLHQETITLRIHAASRLRDLNHDRLHHSLKPLVEVEMSLAQWGSLVSSVGIGSGVPVTLRATESDPWVPEFRYRPRIAQNMSEVTGSVNKLLARLRETYEGLRDAIDNKSGVRVVRQALSTHGSALSSAESNAQFAVDSMTEAGERVVAQVKADIEVQALDAQRLVGAGAEGSITAPELPMLALQAITPDEEAQVCRECGEDCFTSVAGTAHHLADESAEIDHDRDADHVAIPDNHNP